MEAREALERVQQAQEVAVHADHFGRNAALLVSVMAALLAIATIAGNRATTEAVLAQQKASDAWNEFQANSLKRHVNEDTAVALRVLAAGGPREAEALAQADALDAAVATKYRPAQDDLGHKAQDLEHERDVAERQHHGFQEVEAAFQLAIVLSSVSIVARTAPLLWAGAGLGLMGLLLFVNTLALAIPMPF